MRFYNREEELLELQTIWNQVDKEGKLVVLTGRRRLGKTLLATKFAAELPFIYIFIEKKPEALLCQDLLPIIKESIPFPVVGEIKRCRDIFALLLERAKKEKIVVIFDEFQEFFTINPSVYSEFQNLWDAHKSSSKMLFIAVGSVYSLMHTIFEDKKEPLFGRADRIIKLAPFSIKTLSMLLKDHNITNLREIFDFYVLTGSVPKYLDLLLSNGVKNRQEAFSFMLREFSPFLEEGKHAFIEEFGKEYGTYFAILELISLGKTSRSEIESILGCSVGGFMEKLEETYNLIYRITPFDEKKTVRRMKFAIKDPFLQFWFRFFYRNKSAIELKNFSYIQRVIDRDYSMYCGRMLERFFLQLLAEQKTYNRLGTYWEAKNLNEIDIVAANDLDKKLFIAEVKLNPNKSSIIELREKAHNITRRYADYEIEFACLSLPDVVHYL